jgi:hypothetical protein
MHARFISHSRISCIRQIECTCRRLAARHKPGPELLRELPADCPHRDSTKWRERCDTREWRDIEKAKEAMIEVQLFFHEHVFPHISCDPKTLDWFEHLSPKRRAIYVALMAG